MLRIHVSWLSGSTSRKLLRTLLVEEIELTDEDFTTLGAKRPTAQQLRSVKALIVTSAGIPEETREVLQEFPHLAVYNLHYNAAPTAEMAVALMLAAAKRTGRVVTVHEAPRFCGFAAEISAIIAENVIEYMEAPIARVTGFDTPFPNTLEHHYLPDHRRVVDAIEHVYNF